MIIGFIGGIGSGKTLSMTQSLYDDYLQGKRIYTNYGLKFKKHTGSGDVIKLDKQFFIDYTKSGLELMDSSVAIDEAHVFVDSRRAMSPKNKLFSKFITQSRKRSVNLYYTTQDNSVDKFYTSGQVDLRLRKLTDYLVFCKAIKKNGNIFIINKYYNNNRSLFGQKIFNGNDFFKMYDTNEIIDIDD